jgi:hypothetical protein
VNEMREKTESGNARAQKQQGKTSNSTMRARTLKIYHAGPAWIRRASFNTLLRGGRGLETPATTPARPGPC